MASMLQHFKCVSEWHQSAGKVQTKRQWYQLQSDGSIAIANSLIPQKVEIASAEGIAQLLLRGESFIAFICTKSLQL